MSSIECWRNRVETHHAQSIKAQGESWSSGDFWRPFASAFRSDPHRTDDPILNALIRRLDDGQTALDVGGGAGRFALPLALRCDHVTVVEPSESMVSELRVAADEAGIGNLTVVQESWEEAEVQPAGIALCSHVVYGATDIEPFIRKLESHAKEQVLMLMFMDSPQAKLSPLWERVHGEERVDLPALPQLLEVLWELEIFPDLEMVKTATHMGFENRDDAFEQLRQRLYVKPDTEHDRRLQSAVRDLLVETSDGFVIRDAHPGRQGLVSWRPG